MATYFSILVWKKYLVDRGGLQSMGSERVGYDSATKHEVQTCYAEHGSWFVPFLRHYLALHCGFDFPRSP